MGGKRVITIYERMSLKKEAIIFKIILTNLKTSIQYICNQNKVKHKLEELFYEKEIKHCWIRIC